MVEINNGKYKFNGSGEEIIKDLSLGIGIVIASFSEKSGITLERASKVVLSHINAVVMGSILLAARECDEKESAAK